MAVALPGALLVYLSFNSGGFFVDTTALVAVFLAVALVVRVVAAEEPFAGLSVRLGLAAGALGLYAAWTLLSSTWSHAPGRALIEFDRTLLYLFALALFGSIGWTAERLRWLVRVLALAAVAVCVAAFVSRTVPELWTGSPSSVGPDRLNYPLTYWNALGAVAALATILLLHLSASLREPAVGRVLATAALPVVAATLVFTFSRGAIAACGIGIVTYAVLARPRALLSGVIAAAPPVAVAAIVAYNADDFVLGASDHDVALVVLACTGVAALLRAVTLPLDRPVAGLISGRPQLVRWAGVATLVAALALGLAAGGAGAVERQVDRFFEQDGVGDSDARARLTSAANNGRVDTWEVALEGFHADELRGRGAGTYPLLWNQYRPSNTNTIEGHSLYVETLGELGLVGLLLVVTAIGALLVGTASRVRGRDRTVYAALFAAMLAWAVQAGVDWLWEMPAVTLWVFCAGGAALAARAPERAPPPWPVRAATVAGVLVLAATPALVGVSQRQLNDSIGAFNRDDCSSAVDAALSSISTLGARPEPYEILGYCDAQAGLGRPAIRAFEAAVRRDRRNWELYYGLALARAASGLDPRPAARTALRLNPRSPLAEQAVKRLGSTESARRWRRQARLFPPLVP